MRIIIADGSAIVRAIIEQKLKENTDVSITAVVSNLKKALQSAKTYAPELIISGNDIEQAGEREALNSLTKELNIPVILLAEDTVPALPMLADTIQKPNLKGYSSDFISNLIKKAQALMSSAASDSPSKDLAGGFKVLCIGASTGGPTAVAEVLQGLGNNFPLPILYTQHIEIGADKNLVEWLSGVCKNLVIKLAEDGETALPGTVYMAPADIHLEIEYVKQSGYPILKLSNEAPERFLRPAVNKLFRSAAKFYTNKCLTILLTGMGADGAEGCKDICNNGGWTIVEDKSTCAVFGMPAAAIEAGAAKEILPRGEISGRILELVNK